MCIRDRVYIGENVINSIVIPKTWRPNSLTINILVLFEPELRTHIQTFAGITQKVPVHKVFGVKYRQHWHGVQGCSGQVKIIVHTNQIRIRKLVVKQWIGKGSISIVRSPGLVSQISGSRNLLLLSACNRNG